MSKKRTNPGYEKGLKPYNEKVRDGKVKHRPGTRRNRDAQIKALEHSDCPDKLIRAAVLDWAKAVVEEMGGYEQIDATRLSLIKSSSTLLAAIMMAGRDIERQNRTMDSDGTPIKSFKILPTLCNSLRQNLVALGMEKKPAKGRTGISMEDYINDKYGRD